MSLFIIYPALFVLGFPFLLAVYLDEAYLSQLLEYILLLDKAITDAIRHARGLTTPTTTTTTTTTPHYNLVTLNQTDVVRSICYRRSESGVNWEIVFFPFFVSGVCAIAMIVMRSLEARHLRKSERQLESVYRRAKARVMTAVSVETSAGPQVASATEAVLHAYIITDPVTKLNRGKGKLPNATQMSDSRTEAKFIVIDSFVLVVCIYAYVVYPYVDRCSVRDMDSKGRILLPVSTAIFCVVVNVFASLLLFHANNLGAFSSRDSLSKRRRCKARIIVGLCVVSAQQLMLLLEMFTFFRGVSFVFVFSPLLVATVVIFVDLCCHFQRQYIFPMVVILPAIFTSTVLLMLKADNFFGVGTALFPITTFPWIVVIVPVWICVCIFCCGCCCCDTTCHMCDRVVMMNRRPPRDRSCMQFMG